MKELFAPYIDDAKKLSEILSKKMKDKDAKALALAIILSISYSMGDAFAGILLDKMKYTYDIVKGILRKYNIKYEEPKYVPRGHFVWMFISDIVHKWGFGDKELTDEVREFIGRFIRGET